MPKRKCAFTDDLKREYPYIWMALNVGLCSAIGKSKVKKITAKGSWSLEVSRF